jgi:hypothetical protein
MQKHKNKSFLTTMQQTENDALIGRLQMCSYSSMDGVLYCKTHFEQLFKETGSFSKNFTPGNVTVAAC